MLIPTLTTIDDVVLGSDAVSRDQSIRLPTNSSKINSLYPTVQPN